jgi:hypothetical protein
MCDRSGPDTGAALCLTAIGQQDTYLLGEGKSFFNYEPKQHSEFRKFHRNYTVYKPNVANTGWPFGNDIKVTFRPQDMGDLLCNMYIKIVLPKLSDLATNETAGYAENIGKHLFKKIDMRVDETILETYSHDIGLIYDELYTDSSEKLSKIYTDGRTTDASSKTTVYIPIPLFFSRNYESDDYEQVTHNRPYFPLCSINKQKLEFDITFNPQTFFALTNDTLELDDFDIITEEITLTHQERLFLTSNKYTMITDIFKRHPSEVTEENRDTFKIELTPENRVKTLHFFFRNIDFEDENVEGSYYVDNTLAENKNKMFYKNRFNFTTSDSFDNNEDGILENIVDSIDIFIDNQRIQNLEYNDHTYYRYITGMETYLSSTKKNIYSYTFSMIPRNVNPSGSLDFTNIKNNRTSINCNLRTDRIDGKTFTFNMYYTCYKTFTFENGYLTTRNEESISYSPTSNYMSSNGKYSINDEMVLETGDSTVMLASFPE